MRVFITAPFRGRKNQVEIDQLCSVVKSAGFVDFCFVRDIEEYETIFSDANELMKRTLQEIATSDALLIDMTNKPTGRAIEAGIAYALGKKIIVVFKNGTVIKDAVRGIADIIIPYDSLRDIVDPLKGLESSNT